MYRSSEESGWLFFSCETFQDGVVGVGEEIDQFFIGFSVGFDESLLEDA